MVAKLLRKSWLHLLIWTTMLIYFFVAPGLVTRAFTKTGKPLQAGSIPVESHRVNFGVEGLEPYAENGEKLYNLFGWALLTPETGASADSLIREVVLVSDEETYFFSVTTGYRHPRLPNNLAKAEVDWDHLGFYALIADDVIKPGKYRVGFIFKDPSSGTAYYRDKPHYYLIKTPNALQLDD